MANALQLIGGSVLKDLESHTKERKVIRITDIAKKESSMTDKVQKIREEVERLKRWNDNVRESTRHMTLQEEVFNRGKHSSYLEILNFIDSMQEEPVSEDLDIAASEYLKQNYDIDNIYEEDDLSIRNTFKAGAQWQKEQFEKNRLKHCNSITNEQAELEQGFIDQHLDKYNRMPTFLDAIEYGIDYGKQQMMKEAVEGEITYGKSLAIPSLAYRLDRDGLDFGDKVKVLIIKED